MNVLLLSSVQRILGVSADGLAMLTLLALGTFTAGVHVNSLRICLLGLLMVLGVPAIAWVEEFCRDTRAYRRAGHHNLRDSLVAMAQRGEVTKKLLLPIKRQATCKPKLRTAVRHHKMRSGSVSRDTVQK